MAGRVLVIASDTLPLPGLPTSGGGLRSWQMIRGLEAHGFEVVGSMPLFTRLSREHWERIPREARRVGWTFETQDDLVDGVRPDVVVFMNAETYALRRHRLPTVFDLAGPRLIEAQYARVPDQMTRVARKIEHLRLADLVTCAGPRQRYYFLAFLLQAGLPVEDIRIEVVPMGGSPDTPARRPPPDGEPTLVFGGGFHPWQDPGRALLTVADHLERRGRGRLDVYGWSPGPDLAATRAAALIEALGRSPRARVHGYLPYDDLVSRYTEATAAVDLMAKNPERELAFTTRTVQYLWCGLPVIYDDYADLSTLIRDHEAGWCLDPQDEAGLRRVVDEILDDGGRVAARSARAQRLVREELSWERTVRPLAAFCRNPTVRPRRYYEAAYAEGVGAGSSELQVLRRRLVEIEGSMGWRVLTRMRGYAHRALPPGSRRGRGLRLALLGVRTGQRVGWGALLRRALHEPGRLSALARGSAVARLSLDEQYQGWLERQAVTPERRRTLADQVAGWPHRPRISVILPVFETEERWLRAAIESVRRQVYPEWELCVADDGSTSPRVAEVLVELTGDPRVRVTRLPENRGIAAASNAALALATGEWVAFLDHDDELTEDALWHVARRLQDAPDVDLVYTDEDMLLPDGRRESPIFKPDWSPDLLLSFNYITHLCVIRRSVVEAVGSFRLGLDGAQDHDLFLRATEKCRAIAHVPRPLYGWRRVPGSTALSPGAKPLAHEAGRRAVEDALRRRHGPAARAEAEPGRLYRYRARYPRGAPPLVSVIVAGPASPAELTGSLRALRAGTAYPRLEVVVVSAAPPAAGLEARWVAAPEGQPMGPAFQAGATSASGAVLVFYGPGLVPAGPEWLDALVEHALRSEVGAVGGKLLGPDGAVASAGLVLRPDGVAGDAFAGHGADDPVYHDHPNVIRNWSAVSGDGLAVRREAFERVGGFDPVLGDRYGDVDLCLKLAAGGLRTLGVPHARLRRTATAWPLGPPAPPAFLVRWRDRLAMGDPYYNPNLSLEVLDHLHLGEAGGPP